MTDKEKIFANKKKLQKLEKERQFWYRRFLLTKHYKTKTKLENVIYELSILQIEQNILRTKLIKALRNND